MYILTKNNITQKVYSDVQLAAYLKSGWKLIEEKISEIKTQEIENIPVIKSEPDIISLRKKADLLGIKYRYNTSANKLKQLIDEYKGGML